ncbi:MAG: F0F1 ATP synthase subunit delta [Minisyncoccia bacterium]
MDAETVAHAVSDQLMAGQEPDAVFAGLLRTLKERGATRLLPRIATAYERIVMVKNRNLPRIVVAKRKDTSRAVEVALATFPGITPDDIQVQYDDTLIGGFNVEHKGRRLSQSYKSALLRLYRNITNGDI